MPKLLLNLPQAESKHKAYLQSLIPNTYRGQAAWRAYSQTELLQTAKKIDADAIVLNHPETLAELVAGKANHRDWYGSRLSFSKPVLVIPPLPHLNTVPHAKFLFKQYFQKLKWIHKPAIKLAWKHLTTIDQLQHLLGEIHDARMLTFDIETSKVNLITVIGMTLTSKSGRHYTYVVSTDSDAWGPYFGQMWEMMRKIFATSIPKCAHNGAFDCYHMMRYGIAVNNYIFDTEYFWFSWFSELEKSLDFISSVLLYDHYYWKHTMEDDILKYNARDCLTTARIMDVMLQNAPKWAFRNYAIKFPEVFYAITTSFGGIKIDQDKHAKLKEASEKNWKGLERDLQIMSGTPDFNPGSPKQVAWLLYNVVGAKKMSSAASTDEATLQNLQLQHPLLERLCDAVLSFRKEKKADSTYYNAALLAGRLRYHQRIDGAKTGRQSASASTLYVDNPSGKKKDEKNYGTQVQNVPEYYKGCMVADDGYDLGEVDKEQSDARYVSYLAPCENMINDLEGEGDFYLKGIKKTYGMDVDKEDPMRQLQKKVVHGTNYLLGVKKFIAEHGVKFLRGVLKRIGKEEVSLQSFVKEALVEYRQKLYPEILDWWEETRVQIKMKGFIQTPDGWVRIFFGNPDKNHKVLRDAVAHQPQHMTSAGLNKSLFPLAKLQWESNHEFINLAQIHDSVFFQSVSGKYDHYMEKVLAIMNSFPHEIKGRVLNVPLNSKKGKIWGAMKTWRKDGGQQADDSNKTEDNGRTNLSLRARLRKRKELRQQGV